MTAAPEISGQTPAPTTTAGKIADFENRREAAAHAAPEKSVKKQHDRGKATARERIGAADRLPVHDRLALADEDRGQMRERREKFAGRLEAASPALRPGIRGLWLS